MTTRSDGSAASDREIVVTRTIGGPRSLVFRAFSDAKYLAQWWGPDGFTTTTHRFAFRPGGVWEFIMHGPDGIDYPNYIEYREIVPPDRIVLLHGDKADDPDAFTSTITFIEHDGQTDVTMRALFRIRALRDKAVKEYGAIEGGKQTLGRLATFVATLIKSEDSRA